MNSTSYWSFRSAGALGEIEPDDPSSQPSEPFRCDCGAFLARDRFTVQTFEEEPCEDDPEFGYIPGRPAGEVFIWPCRRCKKWKGEVYYT